MNKLQIRASDPQNSCWVLASAGTGKTKILTDRVLRLLINGVSFDKIICITFTNVGAIEMKERIYDKLLNWSKYDYDGLILELKNMIGRIPTQEEYKNAATLYLRLIQSQDQLHVYTIHAFCQKILKMFPAEANISPYFKIIDETQLSNILQEIKNSASIANGISDIYEYLVENLHDTVLDSIFSEIIGNADRFEENIDFKEFKKSDHITNSSLEDKVNKIIKNLKNNIYVNKLKYLSITHDESIRYVFDHHILYQDDLSLEDIELLKSFFLTQKGEKRKIKIKDDHISLTKEELQYKINQIQDLIFEVDQMEKRSFLTNYSKLITILAGFVISSYNEYKKLNGLLDYDDLISKTKKLLSENSNKEWILYKLDGGIEHLLVDEAQDTSASQWGVIQALVEEIYSGNNELKDRTFFVVGDDKQSIFSFQGADVNAFYKVHQFFKKKMRASKKKFLSIDLDISYRSSNLIVDLVHFIFEYIRSRDKNLLAFDIKKIKAHRNVSNSTIEFWDIANNDEYKPEAWSKDHVINAIDQINSGKKLAEKIANFIRSYIDSAIIMDSTKQRVKPSDFLILFRKRDAFMIDVMNAIEQVNIPTSGLDRINLYDSLIIKDVIALSKFIINPNDDLNFSAVLKSYILPEEIRFDDNQLQKLLIIKNRIKNDDNKKYSVWGYINYIINNYEIISDIISDIEIEILKDIYDLMQKFILINKIYDLNNFFHIICNVTNIKKNYSINGQSVYLDILDEFLYSVDNYVKTFLDYSLVNFINWFENNNIEIKRPVVSGADQVRIMTSHASKGLQAPIVILCDTTNIPKLTDRMFFDCRSNISGIDNEFIAVQKSKYLPDIFNEVKEFYNKSMLQEYYRLLYVAMTRAEDHLIMCGYGGKRKLPDNSWYKICNDAVKNFAEQHKQYSVQDKYFLLEEEEKLIIKNSSKEINNIELQDNLELKQSNNCHLSLDNDYSDNKSITNFIEKDSTEHVNVILQKDHLLEYGVVFHKVIEDIINVKDINLLDKHPMIDILSKKNKNRILNAIKLLKNNQEFCNIVERYNSITEINVNNIFDKDQSKNNYVEIKRIDLLLFKSDAIEIIDYKSDKYVPDKIEEIKTEYIKQLKLYKDIVSKHYEKGNVKCKILWLEKAIFHDLNI